MRYVESSSLDLLQELSEVVVVKGKGSDQQSVQDHSARPNVSPSTVVTFTLEQQTEKCSNESFVSVHIIALKLYLDQAYHLDIFPANKLVDLPEY